MRSFLPNVKSSDVRSAARVGLSVGLPLCLLYALGALNFGVYAAFGALTSLYGHSESGTRRVETQAVAGAAIVLTVALSAVLAALDASQTLLCLMLPLLVIGAGTLGAVMGWVPRGEIFFILILLVVAGIPLKGSDLPAAIGAGAGGALLSVLLTALGPGGGVAPREIAARLRLGRAGLDVRQHAVVIGAAALGVTLGWLAARALDIGHPFWAPIAVAAVMPALASDIAGRTFHLLAGTAGGVALSAVLFAGNPAPLTLIFLIAACQAAAELFVARNYALALLFITPLAIGMSNLGRGLAWSPLLVERLGEGVLGALVGVAVILAFRPILAAVKLERDPIRLTQSDR